MVWFWQDAKERIIITVYNNLSTHSDFAPQKFGDTIYFARDVFIPENLFVLGRLEILNFCCLFIECHFQPETKNAKWVLTSHYK